MADDTKSLAQTYYDEVEALKGSGTSNADAIRQVAAKHGKKENAVRSGIHQYKARHIDSNGAAPVRRGRKPAATVDDMIAQATQSLETAMGMIDHEVDAAEQQVNDAEAALKAAQQHYAAVVDSVKARKAELEQKLKALA